MAKTITKKFIQASVISVLISVLLSKAVSIAGGVLSSDIMITGSSSAAVKMLPAAANYLSIFFISAAVAFSIASVFYSLTYFGKKTARRVSLISVLIYFAGTALSYAYAAAVNTLSLARLLAAALTLLIDIAYFGATLAAAWLVCSVYLKKIKKKSGSVSFVTPVLSVNAVLLFVRLADLTLSSVLPFVLNNTVIASDVKTIAGDYIYYITAYGILPFVLTLLALMLYKYVTGSLMPKILINKNEKEQ